MKIPSLNRNDGADRYLVWFVVAGAVAVGLVGIDRSPITWVDEVFYADPARHLARDGRLITTLFGASRGLDRAFFLLPPFSFIERGAVFAIFGFGKWAERLASLAEYALVLVLVARLVGACVRRSPWRGYLMAAATCLLACDAGVIEAYRSGRSDLLGVALVVASGLVLVNGPSEGAQTLRRMLLAGLLAGLAAMTHPTQAAFVLGLLAGAMVDEPASARRRLALAATFGLGAALPVAGWSLQIASAPAIWVDQFVRHVSGASSAGTMAGGHAIDVVFERLIGSLHYFTPMPLGLVACSVLTISGAMSGKRGSRVPIGALMTGALLFLSGESFVKFWAPWLYVSAASGVEALRASGRLNWLSRRAVTLIFLVPLSYVPIPLARAAVVVMQWRARDEAPVRALVAKLIPPGVDILSVPQGYFALIENRDEPMYPEPLYGLRLTATAQDIELFRQHVLLRRPPFAMLSSGADPASQLGFITGASFESLGGYDSPSLSFDLLQRAGYGVEIWRIRYEGQALR